MKIGIAVSERFDAEKKKDADKSGIGIKITRIAHFSFTVRGKISNYQLLETALTAMVIIGMIDHTDSFRMTIDDIMSRLEEGC